MKKIRISFGIIVLNGEPFLTYNLRSLYKHAHQIIIVEGACPSAAAVATKDGHSSDNTLVELRRFQRDEDPESKVLIVTAEDEGHENGFWEEKDTMSQAYAKRATGNYLWQVDIDEFYTEDGIVKAIQLLESERPDAVSFPMITFWGGLKYIVNSFYLIRDNAQEYHRLFAWGPGYTYSSHRPPTVLDANGVNTRKKHWLRAGRLKKSGIFLFHYSLLLPLQVFNKVSYYRGRVPYAIDSWEESVYRRLEKPFRVHNVYQHIGWLERFGGEHPRQATTMMADIAEGALLVETRNCQDIELLLSRSTYVCATKILRAVAHIMANQPFVSLYKAYASLRYRLSLHR